MKPGYTTLVLIILGQCHAALAATNSIDPEQLAYNLKTTLDAYEQVGRKNPKWDAHAKKCLTTFARIRSWTNGTPDALFQELKTNVAHAMVAGCDDPLIRYLHLRFGDVPRGVEFATAYGENATAMQGSEYPAIRKFYVTMWARKALLASDQRPSEAATMLTTAASYLAKALADPSMPLREADQACNLLMTAPWWAESARWDCYSILEPALTNRWKASSAALLAKGCAYLSYAWQARGAGTANSVSGNGWQLFTERLNIAADALEAAWKADPQNVRICLEMMRVKLGQNTGREQFDLWFQRGMKLDPSSYDLCYEKLEYLRPRWYGSAKEMIDFGREATKNTNWTGEARLMLAYAHEEASREIQDDRQRADYWLQPGVWTDVQFTFDQFFKLYPTAVGYRHNYARYATWCRQPQEFLNQIKMFPSTNYSYFGGEEQFNRTLQWAEQQVKKQ